MITNNIERKELDGMFEYFTKRTKNIFIQFIQSIKRKKIDHYGRKKNKIILTTNVLSTVMMMMSSYQAIYTKIHRVYHFHYYQQINPHNLNVHYRFDHMENEEHLENLIELEYS